MSFVNCQRGNGARSTHCPVVLFNLMGLWPIIYASLVLTDGRDQTLPAWPFVVSSFGFGALALMPYLALRKSTNALLYRAPDTTRLKVFNQRLVGIGGAIATILLIVYGIQPGTWSESGYTSVRLLVSGEGHLFSFLQTLQMC
ncbi:hypothetical protein SPB21_12910 [Leptothoe sp. ISB3NOV94-8A]